MSIKRVGFCGLGLMGGRMAMNLKKKGFEVTVWNRSPEKAKALESYGLQVAATPAEVAAGSDAFCTCVANPQALREVALGPDGLKHGARNGQLFIDFSTISVQFALELADAFEEKKVGFVDAPVTGSKTGAEKGTLLIMAGGEAAEMERAKPIFEAVGEKVVHCGPVGAGTQVKLAGNAIIAAMLQSLSEGMLVTSKAGVDPRKLLEVVQASAYRSPYYESKGKALLEHDFDQHFSVDLMHKDLALFLDNAAVNRVPTPSAAAMREVYNTARAAGKGDLDITGVISAYEEVCGHKIGQTK